jgi:hypothetical protein
MLCSRAGQSSPHVYIRRGLSLVATSKDAMSLVARDGNYGMLSTMRRGMVPQTNALNMPAWAQKLHAFSCGVDKGFKDFYG